MVINICTWPSADKANVIHHQDGSLTMKSLEDNAAVTLSACRQTFISKLLYQVCAVLSVVLIVKGRMGGVRASQGTVDAMVKEIQYIMYNVLTDLYIKVSIPCLCSSSRVGGRSKM